MILALNIAAAAFMAGVIWVMQIVQYPEFGEVSDETFPKYHKRHVLRITFIVAPAMLAEAILAVALVYTVPVLQSWLALAAVFGVWIATAIWSVPAHNRLSENRKPELARALVTTNWLRTTLWTLRVGLLISLV